jgi:Fe-S cluster assembly iron-binding protein IscA
MFTLTDDAASVLKAAKKAEGVPSDAGIRIRSADGSVDSSEPVTRIGFAISDGPNWGDEEFEQDGLRIFVEDTLVEPLEDRTLDVQDPKPNDPKPNDPPPIRDPPLPPRD